MQKQSACIKCKYNLFKPVCSVKITVFNQNNNVQWYFHIFKVQKISKSSKTIQGIVQSGLLLLCTELTLFCIELPENCIYLNHSELSNFFMYLINKVIQHSISQNKLILLKCNEKSRTPIFQLFSSL